MKKLISFLIIFFFHTNLLAVLIPYARNADDKIMDAENAPRTSGPFYCIECKKQLILRRGSILKPHFAHSNSAANDCTGGGPETWQHILAKQLLAENLDKWQFNTSCINCFSSKTHHNFPTDQGFESHIEYRFDPYVVDVMICRQNEAVTALEVRHSHAVDEQKWIFFREKGLNILEVKAQDVLDNFYNKEFKIACIQRERCEPCEEENKRQCIVCKKWDAKQKLYLFNHSDRDFACFSCLAYCPACDDVMTGKEIADGHYCQSCASSIETWERESEKAVHEQNLRHIKKLIKNAPAMINTSFLEHKYQEIKQQLLLEQQKVQEQEALSLLNLWKKEAQEAIKESDNKKIEILLRDRPKKSDEESALLCEELLCKKVSIEEHLKQKAQKIFEEKSVVLMVPQSDREKVDIYYPEWTDQNCRVKLSHIEECRRWLQDPEVIPYVLALLEKERIEFTQMQKKRDLERKTPAPKRTIHAYFGTKK